MKRKAETTHGPLGADSPKEKKICTAVLLPYLPPEIWSMIGSWLGCAKSINALAATDHQMRACIKDLRFLFVWLQLSWTERNVSDTVLVNHTVLRSDELYRHLAGTDDDAYEELQVVLSFPNRRARFVYNDMMVDSATYRMEVRPVVGTEVPNVVLSSVKMEDWETIFEDRICWDRNQEEEEEEEDEFEEGFEITDRKGTYSPPCTDDWSWLFQLYNHEKHGLEIEQVVIELN